MEPEMSYEPDMNTPLFERAYVNLRYLLSRAAGRLTRAALITLIRCAPFSTWRKLRFDAEGKTYEFGWRRKTIRITVNGERGIGGA